MERGGKGEGGAFFLMKTAGQGLEESPLPMGLELQPGLWGPCLSAPREGLKSFTGLFVFVLGMEPRTCITELRAQP